MLIAWRSSFSAILYSHYSFYSEDTKNFLAKVMSVVVSSQSEHWNVSQTIYKMFVPPESGWGVLHFSNSPYGILKFRLPRRRAYSGKRTEIRLVWSKHWKKSLPHNEPKISHLLASELAPASQQYLSPNGSSARYIGIPRWWTLISVLLAGVQQVISSVLHHMLYVLLQDVDHGAWLFTFSNYFLK